MNRDVVERIKTAFDRNGRAIELRPGVGQKTAVTQTRVTGGLRVETSEGRWTLVSDASEKSGGGGEAADPGFVVRAALGNCLAMGYVTWAAYLGVPIESVEIEMHADFDVRGQHGADGIPPGFSEIRYRVRIVSNASEGDVRRVIEQADRTSMVGDVFRRAHTLTGNLEVIKPAA
jgi:uncharacterized OsmC-like protein